MLDFFSKHFRQKKVNNNPAPQNVSVPASSPVPVDAMIETNTPFFASGTPFPDKPEYAIFRCIDNLRAGKAALDDLLVCVRNNDKSALEKKIFKADILGPDQYFTRLGLIRKTLNAEKITPLDYALLTGNQDAVTLLLALGADITNEFKFMCTSFVPDVNVETLTSGSLFKMTLECGRGDTFSDLDENLSDKLFLALLQRKESDKLFQLIINRFNSNCRNHQQYYNHKMGSYAKGWLALNMMLSLEKMDHSIGKLDVSYKNILEELISKFRQLKNDIANKVGLYSIFNDEGVRTIHEDIDASISFFENVLKNIDPQLSHEQYLQNNLNAIKDEYKDFFKTRLKNYYKNTVLEEMVYRNNRRFTGDDFRWDAMYLLQDAVSIQNKVDSDVFRETLFEEVAKIINSYAKIAKDASLQAAVDALSSVTAPIDSALLNQTLHKASEAISDAISHRPQGP